VGLQLHAQLGHAHVHLESGAGDVETLHPYRPSQGHLAPASL
jgi:hypothetical protein